MTTASKRLPWKIIAAISVLLSEPGYAAAVFDPDSQPAVMLGSYVLQHRDLLSAPTRAYRPWFENGSWQGDLVEYEISTDGERTISHALAGSQDNTALLAHASELTQNWMARATFLRKEQEIADYWQQETIDGRQLFTYSSPTQVAFLWDQLSAAQKLSLDPETLSDPNGDGDATDAVDPATRQHDNYFGPVFNFIRGDRSNETGQPGGFLRQRQSLLGDITTTPVYIGPPTEQLTAFRGYSGFRYARRDRDAVIATPANDGILHFFAATDGSEVMGYIPSMVIGKLYRLAQPGYRHNWYLDGELVVSSAQVDSAHSACTDEIDSRGNPVDIDGCDWRTLLAGGGGAGFAGLFVLDLTTAGYHDNVVLFEKTGPGFGHIYGAPRIAALGTVDAPDWYIFTGSGYRSTCSGNNDADCDTDTHHPTALLMVSLADPENVHTIDTGTTGGLSAPVLINSDATDLNVETAFAGDINGDMWMFRLNKTDPARSSAHKVFDGDTDLPISNRPAVTRHPDSTAGGYILYFGTGSVFSTADALNNGENNNQLPYKQAIHAIHIKQDWIDGTDTSFDPLTNEDLQQQVLAPVDTSRSKAVRTLLTSKPVNYSCNAGDAACETALFSGWRMEFPNCGERLTAAPFIRAGRVQFVTSNPTGLDCSRRTMTGDNWMMSLDYLTGGSTDTEVFKPAGNDGGSAADSAAGKAVVGVGLGRGNISQPVFARLPGGTDKLFINGLILPDAALPGPRLPDNFDILMESPAAGTNNTATTVPGQVLLEFGELSATRPVAQPDTHGGNKTANKPGSTNLPFGAAVPATVIPIETIDLETAGPRVIQGQRSWIDLIE